MTQTKLETLINRLLDTYPSGSTVAGYRLQVIDGPGATDIRNNVLFVGASLFSPAYSGSSSQTWGPIGNLSRNESLDVNCALRVGIGNRDMAGCRARAIAIFEAIAMTFRSSITALTGNGEFKEIQMSRYRMYQEYSADGVSATIEFTVSAVARV